MRVYIYTVPKAGTYLLADYIARLGFTNTGFHVNRDDILNTKKLDMDTNVHFPSRAMEKRYFMRTFREQPKRSITFGHFPAPFMGFVFPDFFYVCAYRHPRKTLMAEFVDFRFRRQDIDWLSPAAIENDQQAFAEYLRRNGPMHMAIFGNMIGISMVRQEPLCSRFDANRIHFLSFDAFLSDPAEADRIAEFLKVPTERAAFAREAALSAETKTKAVGLQVDRDAIWSEESEALYAALEPDRFVSRGRELGWNI